MLQEKQYTAQYILNKDTKELITCFRKQKSDKYTVQHRHIYQSSHQNLSRQNTLSVAVTKSLSVVLRTGEHNIKKIIINS